MAKLRVHCLSTSLDGYAAGPDQDLDNPLGVRGQELHTWVFETAGGLEMLGQDASGGSRGIDDGFFRAGFEGIGATVMGRNMFGPVRGPWGDSDWRGWWGPDPVYHHPVFVLTHHAHDPIEMEGGTTFHFVTDGIQSAYDQAMEAADGEDVRLGGGASAVQQYLRAGLVDELHIAVAPVLLGAGERLLDGLGDAIDLYDVAGVVQGEGATHLRIARR